MFSATTARVHSTARQFRVFNLKVKDAVESMTKSAIQSTFKEIKEMVDKRVWKGVIATKEDHKVIYVFQIDIQFWWLR